MDTFDVAIVGGGFSGIYAASRLADEGISVAIVEGGEGLGGNLRSRFWNGYWIDLGVHNFDMRKKHAALFFEDILQDSLITTDGFNYASIVDTSWTVGCEQPDFHKNDDFCARVMAQLKQGLDSKRADAAYESSYVNYLTAKYGELLSEKLIHMVAKIIGGDPHCLAVDSRNTLSFIERPVIGPELKMIQYKESSQYWNERIGVSSLAMTAQLSDPDKGTIVGYPQGKGMLTFCERAKSKLEEKGVRLYFDTLVDRLSRSRDLSILGNERTTISAEKVFWSLPEIFLSKALQIDDCLSPMNRVVGTCFFVFEVPEKHITNLDYVNDYSSNREVFRYGNQGVFSGQINDKGNTFILAEVWSHPSTFASKLTTEFANIVWRNILDVGFVTGINRYEALTFFSTPVAFTLPLIGWRDQYEQYNSLVESKISRLFRIGYGFRGRNSFIEFFENNLKEKLLS